MDHENRKATISNEKGSIGAEFQKFAGERKTPNKQMHMERSHLYRKKALLSM